MSALPCPACGVPVPEAARFCGGCGARQPEERPEDVARYAEALAALGGRTESWAVAELVALRAELRIRDATHARLAAPAAPVTPAPVRLELDARALDALRAGEQGLLRLRVTNDGPRALRVALTVTTTAAAGPLSAETPVLGPGGDEVVGLALRPELAGQHTVALALAVRGLVGDPTPWHAEPVAVLVGAAGPLQQTITIDARNQRVGIFENVGAASKGGLVGSASWRELALRAGPAPAAPAAPAAGPPLPPVGARGTAVIAHGGEAPVAHLDGVRGVIVAWADPAVRAVLAPGDKLEVGVLGHAPGPDGRPGLLLTTASTAAPVAASADVRVGPGDSLRDALAAARDGARITVSGVHAGPFEVRVALELAGDGVLEAAKGPVLTIARDAVVRGLEIRGAAPAGGYAADAVEIRGGRVSLEGVTLSSDVAGNLVPGRALAITGRATVSARGCRFRRSGIGVAVDVSWSGFPTDGAAGARVELADCAFDDVGTGVAVAGAQRAVTVGGSDLRGCREVAVAVSRGASARVTGSRVRAGALVNDGGALDASGNST